MANSPIIKEVTAYSVLHPMFRKVVKTIRSCKTLDQYNASEKFVMNFLQYIELGPNLGIYPTGYCRIIISSYYGAELRDELRRWTKNQSK